MGNCQAIDAAALVVQHPNGKIERFYSPVPARDLMKNNPGHHVSLIIPLPDSSPPAKEVREEGDGRRDRKRVVRFTRVKLLRHTETLALGHAYRLITSQEVMKVLRAKNCAKMKRQQSKPAGKAPEKQISGEVAGLKQKSAKSNQNIKQEREGQKIAGRSSALTRSKTWRPSLQSISESSS